MQRWTALVFLVAVAVAVSALVVGRRGENAPATPSAVVVLGVPPPPKPELTGVAPGLAPAVPVEPGGGDLGSPLEAAPTTSSVLPASAPRTVSFGVILVTYRGAQGAPPGSRSKEEAQALADKIASKAAEDFEAAIKLGDLGFGDAGEMPREVLEPAAEATLFGLRTGEVSKPVDSPKGFYVFRRND